MSKTIFCVSALTLILLPFTSCNHQTKDTGGETGDSVIIGEQKKIVTPEQIRLTGNIEICNKCGGTGMIQISSGPYGEVENCKFCLYSTLMRINQGWQGFDGRFGQVDAVFNTLPDNYFDLINLDNTTVNQYSASDIQRQIDMYQSQIQWMKEFVNTTSSGVYQDYYSQEIINLEYKIRELESQLIYMQE